MYECTRDTHTRAMRMCIRSTTFRSAHVHSERSATRVRMCICIYTHDANSRSKGEEGIQFSTSTRVFWPRTRCAPILLHCVYMYTYGIISTSTNGGLFERVKTYWIGSIECRESIDVTMGGGIGKLLKEDGLERKSTRFCMIIEERYH